MAITKELFKGTLNTIILSLLEENGRMYGYEITQKIKSITGGEVIIKEGSLYPALHKLEMEGMLTTTVEVVENRVRKYYVLSENGKEERLNKMEEVQEYIRNLQLLLNLKPILK